MFKIKSTHYPIPPGIITYKSMSILPVLLYTHVYNIYVYIYACITYACINELCM